MRSYGYTLIVRWTATCCTRIAYALAMQCPVLKLDYAPSGEPELDLYTGSIRPSYVFATRCPVLSSGVPPLGSPRAFFNELISGKDISHCINRSILRSAYAGGMRCPVPTYARRMRCPEQPLCRLRLSAP
eukprot:1236930-Rhodomonas_salina.2